MTEFEPGAVSRLAKAGETDEQRREAMDRAVEADQAVNYDAGYYDGLENIEPKRPKSPDYSRGYSKGLANRLQAGFSINPGKGSGR